MDNKIEHKFISKIKDFICNSCFKNMSQEVCGFIGYDEKEKKYVAQIEKNEAIDPKTFFMINPINYLNFKNNYSILGIFHSHITGDENPSEFDIKMSESCCLPFFIFSLNTKKFFIYEPQNKDYDVNIFERIKFKIK